MDVSLVHRGWSAQMDLLVRSAVPFWIELNIMPILLTPGLSKQKHSSNSKSGWTNHRFVQMYHNFEIGSGTTWLFHCGEHYFYRNSMAVMRAAIRIYYLHFSCNSDPFFPSHAVISLECFPKIDGKWSCHLSTKVGVLSWTF